MDLKAQNITLQRVSSIDYSLWKQESQIKSNQQLVRQFKHVDNRLVAYAYQTPNDFSHLKNKLEKEVNLYNNNASQHMAKVQSMFFTNIQGKNYIVITRASRQMLSEFSDVIANPQRKTGINIMDTILKITQSLRALENISFSHNNLRLQRINYVNNNNIIIDLPIFPTIYRQLQSLGHFKDQKNQQSGKISRDIKCFVEILLSVGGKVDKKISIFACSCQTKAQMIETIENENIRCLVTSIIQIIEQGTSNQTITFKAIEYYLLNRNSIPIIPATRYDFTQIDILHLNLFEPIQMINHKIQTKPKLEFIKHLQRHQIKLRCFEGYLQIIIVPYSQQSEIGFIIDDNNWNYPLNKHFKNVQCFYKFVVRQTGRFQVTNQGVLTYFVLKSQAMVLEKELSDVMFQQMSKQDTFPWDLVGDIKRGQVILGRCFVINPRIIVTAASVIYDRRSSTRNQLLQCYFNDKKYDCKKFYYPEEYEKCLQETSWQYNYALIYLETSSIQREIMPTVLFNYRETSDNNSLFFSIENTTIDPSQLQIKANQVKGIKQFFIEGCPIFVKRGKRYGLVGINSGNNIGLLFSDDQLRTNQHPAEDQAVNHLEIFYQYMYKSGVRRHQIFCSRFCRFDKFNFEEEQVNDANSHADLMYNDYGINAIEVNISYFTDCPMQMCYILEKEIRSQTLYSAKLLLYYKILLNAYQNYYTPGHWKYAQVYINMCNYQQAFTLLENAQQIQTQGRANPNRLSEIHFSLGYIYQLTKNYQYAQSEYKKSLNLCQKLHNWKMKGRIFHNLGQIERPAEKIADSLQYFEKALEIKQKQNDQADIIFTLISYAQKALKSQNLQKSKNLVKKLLSFTDQARVRQGIDRLDAIGMREAFQKAAHKCQEGYDKLLSQLSTIVVDPEL